MKEVKLSPPLFYLLIILAIFGVISFIILLSNPTLITITFGNNSIFNFNNSINPPIIIGECTTAADCPQAQCVTCLTVCENNKCIIKRTGDRHYCTLAERTNCRPTEGYYKPVCGWYDPSKVNCDQYPCAKTTDINDCPCSNEKILYWTSGSCLNKDNTGTCTSNSQCQSGFSCWYEQPSGISSGIPGSPENLGQCYEDSNEIMA